MPKPRQKLSELPKHLSVECDNLKKMSYYVEYGGPGWYSLDDDGVFREGVRPTYCRIRIH
jgi:hypothetical protein